MFCGLNLQNLCHRTSNLDLIGVDFETLDQTRKKNVILKLRTLPLRLAIPRFCQIEEGVYASETSLQTSIEIAAAALTQEKEKLARYYAEQEKKGHALAKVTRRMADHPMYKLDNRKDQLVSALRLCLVNVLQLLRDTVFPESYAQSTYKTLMPFIQMDGFVIERIDHIEIFFDGFWQSAKQRDLVELVARCNAQRFTTPDGRFLKFAICSSPGHI